MAAYQHILDELGIKEVNPGGYAGGWLPTEGRELKASINPTTEEPIASVAQCNEDDYEKIVSTAVDTFKRWRMVPAPKRGEIVRQIGVKLREYKEPLGHLVSLEMGKILTEGLGEVQEMIDIADFAVGLSRQLYGLTMHSERPGHRMYEQWHPLGPVGVITAFNFPVAVWSWNAMIAMVAGDTLIWKPSRNTPLTAIAVQNIVEQVLKEHDFLGVSSLLVAPSGGVGAKMSYDRRIPLISATGSCRMGRQIAGPVSQRFGRTILELGGNNAVIVMDDADLDLALRAVLFGAVGTAGQRCTTTRRLIMHRSIAKALTDRLIKAYSSVSIGDPLDPSILMGPLVEKAAVDTYVEALKIIQEQGGEIIYGGKTLDRPGYFVEPTLVKAHKDMPITREETFAPILYLFEVDSVEEAIELNNSVDQGLSSSIFTTNLITSEKFLSHAGSDCGIANVNIGTSGAEIGGAFGGEKDTGGGREAGSDAWKAYMRRQTNTINWSTAMPLAQGVKFDLE